LRVSAPITLNEMRSLLIERPTGSRSPNRFATTAGPNNEAGEIARRNSGLELFRELELAGKMGARCVDGLSESDVTPLKAWPASRGAAEHIHAQEVLCGR